MVADTARIVVCFTLRNRARDWADLERMNESDIERQSARFVGGRNSWIAQTYLRLRASLIARGMCVRVSSRFEPGAICIVHRDDANDFGSSAHLSHLVVVRADRPPVRASDHVIVQNRIDARRGNHFVPLWPQPGIIERARERAERVERLAYSGRTGASPAWFYEPAFHNALRDRGVVFDVRERNWNDYRGIDVAIAARVAAPGMLDVKPATKLYNAWLAGVPMLAAPEPAYRELRRSPLDFVEVTGARDVLRALDRFRSEPRLYREMIANGRMRSREFDVDAIRGRWLGLIDDVIVPAFVERQATRGSRRLWFLGAMTQQKLQAKLFRARNEWALCRLARSIVNARRAAFTPVPMGGADVSRTRWPTA